MVDFFFPIPNTHCFPYLTFIEVDGSAFAGFDKEISDYLPVFKYAWRSQQEVFFRKVDSSPSPESM